MPATLDEASETAQREIALTERWDKPRLRPHRMQSLLFHHPARFKFCPSGRRSGKTELVKRKATLSLAQRRKHPARILIGAPTYTRVKEIYFDDLRSMIPKSWIKRIKESTSELEFRTHWGATIRLVGMNKPQVVEGIPWDECFFDEMADYPANCFERNIRPALATPDRPGSAWFVGVPDEAGTNQAEYEKYWDRGLLWPKYPEYCSFWWPSADVGDPKELAEMAEGMDSVSYAQEFLGQFVRSGNRAIPNFSQAIHVDPHYAEYSPFLPVIHSLDFGVRPAASLIAQTYKNQLWILDEIVLGDGSTDLAAWEFLDRAGKAGYDLRNGLHIYGDAAGRGGHSNTGDSDYLILRKIYNEHGLKPVFKNLISNPGAKDDINAVRGRVMDHRGGVSLFIHPRCERLIHELKSAPWPSKLEEFHCLAALRYLVWGLHERGNTVSIGRAGLTEDQRISAKLNRAA